VFIIYEENRNIGLMNINLQQLIEIFYKKTIREFQLISYGGSCKT